MTNEEHEDIHTAFWAGVDATRKGDNLIKAFTAMMDKIEERRFRSMENERR